MPDINKEYIAIGVLSAGIIYLLVMYILQRLKSAQHQKAIVAAKAAYDNVKNAQQEERERIVDPLFLFMVTKVAKKFGMVNYG
jgi:hypothetical protein